ncbi:von Willebrand factor type A domain protein, partial [Ostertagia ostertagi]
MPKESCPTPNDPSDTNRTDVLFLLDSSNSFNEHKFMHAIQLILDTVSQFRNIGPNGTQVSLVQYNSEPYLEFSLRKHNCKQWLIDDIADTDYMQGGSMLGKAVEKVSRFAFTKNRGDRPDAENVLVILTDGQSDDRIQEPVEVAKKHNLTVLVIATLEANPQYLIDLAGNMNNVFQLHTDIKNTLPHKLAQRINSIQAGIPYEFSPLDTFEVKDGHGMITIALPTEEEEEQRPISLNVPPGYEGAVVVKGQEDKEECRK